MNEMPIGHEMHRKLWFAVHYYNVLNENISCMRKHTFHDEIISCAKHISLKKKANKQSVCNYYNVLNENISRMCKHTFHDEIISCAKHISLKENDLYVK